MPAHDLAVETEHRHIRAKAAQQLGGVVNLDHFEVNRRACKLPDGGFHFVAKGAIAPAIEHESGG